MKKLLSLFFALFATFSLWSMDLTVDIYIPLPKELQLKIFNDLDIKSFLNLTQVNRAFVLQAGDEEIWRKLAQKYFGDRLESYRLKDESLREILKKHFTVRKQILNINNWSREELESLIGQNDRFSYFEMHLAKHLEEAVVRWSLSKVDNAKDLQAVLLAYHVFNKNAIWNASKVAQDVAQNFGDTSMAILNAHWKMAASSIWNEACTVLDNACCIADYITAVDDTNAIKKYDDIAIITLSQALNNLNLSDSVLKGQASFKMINLIFLAFISHKDFQDCFEENFIDAKKKVDNYPKFNKLTSDVIATWAQEIWKLPEHKDNPYILALKRIALRLTDEING